jgi:predicted DNA-binding protein (UPF0251 family)
MPRPIRKRKICCLPKNSSFGPLKNRTRRAIELTLDEFETIRLLDYEGFTQEKASEFMDVTRTTVTAIYDSARKKVAEALVMGFNLIIIDGNTQLYNEDERENAHRHFRHHKHQDE